MKVFIDADGCPVVNIAIEQSKKRGIECVILCDTSHTIEREGARTITVSKGADSVDFALVNMLSKGDCAITQDYALAAMCLARGAKVINQNGIIYTDDNILSLLNERETSRRLRAQGGRMKGPKKRRPEQDDAFRCAFITLLE